MILDIRYNFGDIIPFNVTTCVPTCSDNSFQNGIVQVKNHGTKCQFFSGVILCQITQVLIFALKGKKIHKEWYAFASSYINLQILGVAVPELVGQAH